MLPTTGGTSNLNFKRGAQLWKIWAFKTMILGLYNLDNISSTAALEGAHINNGDKWDLCCELLSLFFKDVVFSLSFVRWESLMHNNADINPIIYIYHDYYKKNKIKHGIIYIQFYFL